MAPKRITVIDASGSESKEVLGSKEGFQNLVSEHGVTSLKDDTGANVRDFESVEDGGTYFVGQVTASRTDPVTRNMPREASPRTAASKRKQTEEAEEETVSPVAKVAKQETRSGQMPSVRKPPAKKKNAAPKGIFVWVDTEDELGLVILKKETFEYDHRLWQARKCKTWGEVRGCGDDIYKDFRERYKELKEIAEDWDADRYEDSPDPEAISDEDPFDPLLHLDYKDCKVLDVQRHIYPPFIQCAMWGEAHNHDFLHGFNAFSSSFGWNSDLVQYKVEDKNKIFAAIRENGYKLQHEPDLMDLCIPNLNGWGDWREVDRS